MIKKLPNQFWGPKVRKLLGFCGTIMVRSNCALGRIHRFSRRIRGVEMGNKLSRVLLLVAVLLAANPSFAHHAGTLYDREHLVTVTGTVTEYSYTNPHVHILFDVKDQDGVVSHWTAEAGPPHGMFRIGWNREALKPGDTVTITGNPYKDGKKIMDIRKVAGPNGLSLNYTQDSTPADKEK
jgi:uncharacterized protein DUF6152